MKKSRNDLYDLACKIVHEISRLPDPGWTPQDVYIIFRTAAILYDRSDLGHVFFELDSKPGYFNCYSNDYGRWHRKLRSTRNHPTWGPKLFSVWA